jgi:hypothetical protein
MAKNIFDAVAFDPNKSRIPHLASAAMAAQAAAQVANEVTGHHHPHKGSKKSHTSSNSSMKQPNPPPPDPAPSIAPCTKSSDIVTHSSATTTTTTTTGTTDETSLGNKLSNIIAAPPSMFKIANKLKIFSDMRLKKTQSDTSALLVKQSPNESTLPSHAQAVHQHSAGASYPTSTITTAAIITEHDETPAAVAVKPFSGTRIDEEESSVLLYVDQTDSSQQPRHRVEFNLSSSDPAAAGTAPPPQNLSMIIFYISKIFKINGVRQIRWNFCKKL